MKIKLVLFLVLWAFAFTVLGIKTSNADLVMDSYSNPAYHFMPQNLYHNTIYGNKSNDTKFDVCKTPGSVRKIIIEKSNKKMYLVDVNGCIVKQYDVRLGIEGTKHCEGDMKTPTGIYKIKEKRNSKYVKFLELDYPRAKDIKKAKELGCNPGNAIGIHYYNNEFAATSKEMEHSLGCITVFSKNEIIEIDRLISVGTTVEIKD